jgi:tetratricopeptide (TPR) repeat protein
MLGMAGLGGLWFLVALAPVSNFVVQIGTVFAERYLYIPSIGFAVALGALAALGTEKLRGPARAAPVAGLAVICALWGWATVEAVKPWRNSTALWARVLELDPENHTAWFNAGREKQELALLESDDTRRAALFEAALRDYDQALVYPARTYRTDEARVLIAQASVWLQRENTAQALKCLYMARDNVEQPWRTRTNPAHADRVADIEAILANYLGLAYSARGEHEQAVAAFEEAAAKSGRYVSARVNLCAELGRKALAQNPINEDMLKRAWRELAEYERLRDRDEAAIEQRARLRYAEFSRRLELSGKGGEKTVPPELAPLLDESRTLYAELLRRKRGVPGLRARARLLIEAAEVHARGRPGDATAEAMFREALTLDPAHVGLRTLLAVLLFERGKANVEATELLAEELRRNPGYRPALQLKAAGLRQAAVDGAARLRAKWLPAYREVRNDPDPTWEGLIGAFFLGSRRARGADAFATDVLTVAALMREAIETDPDNTEGHALVEGTGLNIALGLWFTRVPNLRGNAESLLRTAFNARPEDGPVAAVLTEFYLRLAEEVINPPKPPENEQQHRELREGLNELLQNMLTLSERARHMLSGKLCKVGLDVESGRMPVRNADGEIANLSELSRRMVAAEFMRASVLLQSDRVEALDWLKHFYQDEGNLIEAVRVYEQLVEALKDRPKLLHGVNLSLAQLQLDLGQQMLRAFSAKLKLKQDAEAKQMRDKAVRAYLDCLATTEKLLADPEDPGKIAFPVRMRGIAAQRLAYLVTREAEKYYTIALQAYALAPADFSAEIAEVRRKRAWFIENPYQRRAELQDMIRSAPDGADTSSLEEDLRDLDRRIAREEADQMRRRGDYTGALQRLAEPMKAPTPVLYAARGEIYADMARAGIERDENTRRAAADLARAVTEPECLIRAARLYWEDEALIFAPDRIAKARMPLVRAQQMIEDSLETLEPGDKAVPKLQKLSGEATQLRAEMDRLGAANLAAARRLQEDGKLEQALGHAQDAVQMLGDHARAYHRLALIQRDLGRKTADAEARRAILEDARDTLQTGLRMEIPLTSSRLEMMHDLAEILGLDLGERAAGDSWVARAREVLRLSPEALRPDLEKIWKPRLDDLASRLRR